MSQYDDFRHLARSGELPDYFDDWELADEDGKTVAHMAAMYGHLPPDFNRWELADQDGWTVAHEAAWKGALPPGFDRWELADEKGWTVAHVAANNGHLPPDFDRWDLADKNGWTVAHHAAVAETLPSDFDQWDLSNPDGRDKGFEQAMSFKINNLKKLPSFRELPPGTGPVTVREVYERLRGGRPRRKRLDFIRINPDKFKEIMEERFLSPSELARLSGVSPPTIYNVMRGRGGRLRPATIRKMLSGLRLDKDQAVASGILEKIG